MIVLWAFLLCCTESLCTSAIVWRVHTYMCMCCVCVHVYVGWWCMDAYVSGSVFLVLSVLPRNYSLRRVHSISTLHCFSERTYVEEQRPPNTSTDVWLCTFCRVADSCCGQIRSRINQQLIAGRFSHKGLRQLRTKLFTNSATYLLTINLPILMSVAMSLYDIILAVVLPTPHVYV